MSMIKYFIFSTQDMLDRKAICKKLGKQYKVKEVLVNGLYKPFTEILDDPCESRYSDSVVVTYGDIREIRYR